MTNQPQAQAQKKGPNKPVANLSLQDRLYQELKESRIKTRIYLVNGFQLEGIIKEVDNFTILIINEGKEKLIYKHAISTIEPTRPIFS